MSIDQSVPVDEAVQAPRGAHDTGRREPLVHVVAVIAVIARVRVGEIRRLGEDLAGLISVTKLVGEPAVQVERCNGGRLIAIKGSAGAVGVQSVDMAGILASRNVKRRYEVLDCAAAVGGGAGIVAGVAAGCHSLQASDQMESVELVVLLRER